MTAEGFNLTPKTLIGIIDHMPDLVHTLQGNDLGFYKIIAEAWGIELNAPDAHAALPVVTHALRSPQIFQEMIDLLPPQAFEALEILLENEGRLPWAVFCRRFGELRAMGAGRRDRERPDLNPISATEVLWYRALVGKAFMGLPPEPQEYAYIPDEFLEYLQPFVQKDLSPLGRPASPTECAHTRPARDRILDHTCTLLAALRLGFQLSTLESAQWSIPPAYLLALLRAAALVDAANLPQPDLARAFLETSRAQALVLLAQAWLNSQTLNDLRFVPALEFEGDWQNYPLETRRKLMDWLSQLPQDGWWSLPAFIAAVKEREPDFQRPGGDYDSWFVRPAGSTSYLRGFTTWDDVDGALIRFLICGPLHWLGFLDLAAPDKTAAPAAFRPSAWALALWHNQPPAGLPAEIAHLRVTSAGEVRVPVLIPRSARYQIARFCQWESENREEYIYQLTPASLERARLQGLKTAHLTTLLRRHSANPLPPTFIQALERWEKFGAQASLGKASLLRVTAPEILTALRKTRANRFLGELLSPSAVLIRPGGEETVLAALAEMGYLAESKLDV